MKKKTKYFIGVVLVLLLVVFGVPSFINEFIINNEVYSKATNDGWVSFLGSYLGGILGGLATLLGVLITIKVSRKESIKPALMFDLVEEVMFIQNPSHYNKQNSITRIINYRDVPKISEMFAFNVLNTGKGSAKEINIELSIDKDDVLVTDDNRMWLSYVSPLNEVEETNTKYVQPYRYSFIGSEGSQKYLPLNLVMNGYIVSSIWNIENFLKFSEEDFLRSLEHYKVKTDKRPLTIPNLKVKIIYQDIDNNYYESIYTISFEYVYHQVGSHTAIKPRIEFNTSQSISNPNVSRDNKNTEDEIQLSKESELILGLKEYWFEEVLKFGQYCGFEEVVSEIISKDEALERFFFSAYDTKIIKIDDLALKIAFIYEDQMGKLLVFNEDIIFALFRLVVSLLDELGSVKKIEILRKSSFESQSIEELLERINTIATNPKLLKNHYFNSYKTVSENNVLIKIVEDGSEPFITTIDIGSEKLKTELGFYRGGYTYRLLNNEEQHTIQSVAKRLTENSEFGFLDYSGYKLGEDFEWHCTYLR